MYSGFRDRARAISAVLVIALAVVTSVTCLAAAPVTPAQHACCAEMIQGCGKGMDRDQGCCPTEAPALDNQAGPVARVHIHAPAITAFALLTPMSVGGLLLSEGTRPWALDASPPGPGGLPTYLLLSTLRV